MQNPDDTALQHIYITSFSNRDLALCLSAFRLARTKPSAKTLALQGTPAFIVGDTLVPGADIAALKLAIEQARASKAKPG